MIEIHDIKGVVLYRARHAQTLCEAVEHAVAAGVSLAGSDLTMADLTGANLARADLTGADLTGADLTGTKLAGTDLAGAKLAGAKLAGADLTWADLAETDLTETDLTGAWLSGGCLYDTYCAELVPALLRAGGHGTPETIRASWGCHTWGRPGKALACPIATAFGVHSIYAVPILHRVVATGFVALFDAGALPWREEYAEACKGGA